MGLAKSFKTDSNLEKTGIEIEYDGVRVRIARAGGANENFAKALERITKPYRRQIQSDTLSLEKGNDLAAQAFAEAVVLDWETKVGETWERGIDPVDAGQEAESGKLLPVTKENILAVFNNLPDFFADLREQSQKAALFREDVNEAAAGN